MADQFGYEPDVNLDIYDFRSDSAARVRESTGAKSRIPCSRLNNASFRNAGRPARHGLFRSAGGAFALILDPNNTTVVLFANGKQYPSNSAR